jgi:hypothetical protein
MPHLSDTTLENSAMNRLTDDLAACVEEHLLVCHDCQDRAASWDQFVTAIKAGALLHIEKDLIELLHRRNAEWKSVPGDIKRIEAYTAALKTFNAFLLDKFEFEASPRTR